MELIRLHERSVAGFDRLVQQVEPDQWDAPTPCTEWSVRDLVNHVVNENLWTPELLAGRTLEEVGDRFDGDVLGSDPLASWKASADAAVQAVQAVGDLEMMVNVSWGQIPASEYISQLTLDHTVHGWDLARGIGGDDEIDPELAVFGWEYSDARRDLITGSGVFGRPIDVAEGADAQTKLLALLGRRPE
ncbi:MAG: TIGR03086 family metal-binding protein [Actinomycetota bacterium]